MCVALDLISAGHGSLSSGKAELEREREEHATHTYIRFTTGPLSLSPDLSVRAKKFYIRAINKRERLWSGGGELI